MADVQKHSLHKTTELLAEKLVPWKSPIASGVWMMERTAEEVDSHLSTQRIWEAFNARQELLEEKRRMSVRKARKTKEIKELKECTFKPNLNWSSHSSFDFDSFIRR